MWMNERTQSCTGTKQRIFKLHIHNFLVDPFHAQSWLQQHNMMKWYRGGCFIYTPSGRIALLMQTVLMGKSQCPSWWKQGKGTIKRGTMSDNNSVGTSNPSFQAPDVWIPTKSSVYVWQTSVCRHTTVTIMLLITLILCWDLRSGPFRFTLELQATTSKTLNIPIKFPLEVFSTFKPIFPFSIKILHKIQSLSEISIPRKKMCARLPEM